VTCGKFFSLKLAKENSHWGQIISEGAFLFSCPFVFTRYLVLKLKKYFGKNADS
jgi:hypothetical protein